MWPVFFLCGAFLFGISDCKNENYYEHIMKGERPVGSENHSYLAHIWVENLEFQKYNYVCAGAIQSERWVVTSGDCMVKKCRDPVSGKGMYITAGDEYLNHSIKYYVDNIMIHPDYDNSTGMNNIAMIRVERNFEFSDNLQPALTALAGDDVSFNSACNLVRGPIHRQIPTNIITLRMCRSLHRNKKLQFLESDNMCTYDRYRSRYACGQWAGGALLICGEKEKRKLFGILQYSPKYQGAWPDCDNYSNPEVYTKLSGYSSWIDGIISINSSQKLFGCKLSTTKTKNKEKSRINEHTTTAEAITSEEITAEEPTTEEPTTEEPTKGEPTTEEPITEEPTTEEPKTDFSQTPFAFKLRTKTTNKETSRSNDQTTTAEATTSEEITTDDPTTKTPAIEVLKTKDPLTNKPRLIDPTTKEPLTKYPTTEDQTKEERKTDDATSSEEITTEEPTKEESTIEEPTTEEPTTKEPTTEESTTENLNQTTKSPTTKDLTTKNSTTKDPTTKHPITKETTPKESTTNYPTTEDPTTEDPTTEDPTTEERLTDVTLIHESTTTEENKPKIYKPIYIMDKVTPENWEW